MLWHKAWVDTRWRFLIGLAVMLLLAMGTVFGFPLLVKQLLAIGPLPEGDGRVAQAIRESAEISRTFAGFVWLNAFSQNFVQMGTLFAVLLGSGGLRAEAAGTLYTLALPFSRRAIMSTRAASGLAELFALIMIPTLAIVALAPAIGERYSLVAALVHGGCLFAGTAVFFSLTFWLSTLLPDPWRPGLIACGVAVVVALCEAALASAAPMGLFHAARAESYFRGAGVPWVTLLVLIALSAMLLHRAIVGIERQDF
jgi:hypothetical protein